MTTSKLQGVIAAATAVDEAGEPDCARSDRARFLLANGCDALNVLGTTGEATSFSLEQRKRDDRLSRRRADARSPHGRHRRGRGRRCGDADAARRRARICRGAAAAAVLLQGRADDGLAAYVATIVQTTAARPIPIYLYHFPSQSGLPWHVELSAVCSTSSARASSA